MQWEWQFARRSFVRAALAASAICAWPAPGFGAEGQSTDEEHSGWRHERAVLSVAWHPNGRWVATGGDDGLTCVWDVETGEKRLELAVHRNAVPRVAFSPDGSLIASVAYEKYLRMRPTNPDGEPGHSLWFWDSETGRRVSQIRFISQLRPALVRLGRAREYGVRDFAFSPDGMYVGTTGHQEEWRVWPEMVKLWHAPPGGLHQTYSKPYTMERGDWSVVFSPDGRHLVTTGFYCVKSHSEAWDNRRRGQPATAFCMLRIWDIETGTDVEQEIRLEGRLRQFSMLPPPRHDTLGPLLAFHPKGKLLAVGLHNGQVRLLDFPSLELSQEFTLPNESSAMAVAFASDGRLLATNGPDSLVWSEVEGARPFHLAGQDAGVRCAAFSPDGSQIVTGDADGAIVLWNAESGERAGP